MNIETNDIEGILVIEPKVYGDHRGFFCETFQKERYRDAGINLEFVQDNMSRSSIGTLRGLHYQLERPQGKLIWVTRGEVFDVAVDLRKSSKTFGKWFGIHLSEENHRQMYIPPGFAHGFCALTEIADFNYKCTDYYAPDDQHSLLWNDPAIGVQWPHDNPILSEKDAGANNLSDVPCFK